MPNILLIDSYDSFTFNLADLIRTSIPAAVVHVLRNDSLPPSELIPLLQHFDAVVVGPGPGSPDDTKAVGAIPALWQLSDRDLLPVLGVCLGHQSLGLAFGGTLKRLKEVKHGLKSLLEHEGTDIFDGVGQADVVRYHSLHIDISNPSDNNVIDPLAWAVDQHLDGSQTKVLMAARHRFKPYWGVQYHPESICTSGGGEGVVRNFWKLAASWNEQNGRIRLPSLPSDWRSRMAPSSNVLHPSPLVPRPFQNSSLKTARMDSVRYSKMRLPGDGASSLPRICEVLRGSNHLPIDGDFVVLDSSAAPGRYSIIGLVTPTTARIEHVVGDKFVTVFRGHTSSVSHFDDDEDVWKWLARYMDARRCTDGDLDCPFWGGLIGIANYESGVAGLEVPIISRHGTNPEASRRRPDMAFAFVERSVVLDLHGATAYIQSIARSEEDGEIEWVRKTTSLLNSITDPAFTPTPTPPITPDVDSIQTRQTSRPRRSRVKIEMPDEDQYVKNILQAQEFLKAGESYEICLTALTRIRLSPPSSVSTSPLEYLAWRLFKVLRVLNPAPYGTYIRLGGTTLVGSSPERFVSWTRDGLCQLRPIKGTIKKSRPGQPDITFAEAEARLLGSPKEIAENLMIVDLIRHDLHRVVSAGAASMADGETGEPDKAQRKVEVTKLFSVEETETVFHLVTVIEGGVNTAQGYTGWDVLSRSLPPGSMTGAPKKRSVELLQRLERTTTMSPSYGTPTCDPSTPSERGVYSGVCGYWCVGGGGDFSVIIRSAFRYDDESTPDGNETWYLGAGGAITALSTPQEEWEEMKTKLSSALRAFAHI